MKVILAPKAVRDYESIGDYIATDNPIRAESFVEEILDRCSSLADFPNRFPLIERHRSRGIRRCVHGNYLILYRVETDIVRILRIFHGASDYENLLENE